MFVERQPRRLCSQRGKHSTVPANSSTERYFESRESSYYNAGNKVGFGAYLCSSTEMSWALTAGLADSTYSTFAGRFSRSEHGFRSPLGWNPSAAKGRLK